MLLLQEIFLHRSWVIIILQGQSFLRTANSVHAVFFFIGFHVDGPIKLGQGAEDYLGAL